MTDRAAVDDVRAKALETAYRLEAYSFYGGTVGGAIRALKRRCPGWQRDELEPVLNEALLVQRAVRPWLEANEAELRKASAEGREYDFCAFRAKHHDWPADAIDGLVGVNFLYFYLM